MVTVATRMPLIEGVGDEVVFFAGVMVLLIGIVLAWFSTSVADQPLIRAAVLVIERHQATPTVSEHSQEVTNQSQNSITNDENTPDKSGLLSTNGGASSTDQQQEESEATAGSSCQERPTVEQLDGCDSAVSEVPAHSETSDGSSPSENNAFDNNSVECKTTSSYPRVYQRHINTELKKGSSVPLMTTEFFERDIASTSRLSEESVEILTSETSSDNIDLSGPGIIKIRLKFLNDSQRLVDGKLEEPLGDFKRRYFQEELENDKVVRLIFNGQLLRSDQETLQFYGLHDNCVVHCQISNNVNSPSMTQTESFTEFDLSRFMLPLFGVILGVVWYCRIQYRQFFNATSTFALLGITVLFFVSVAALLFPRRETRRPWAN